MLAYVFWHWPTPQTDRTTYENHLRDFHRALAAGKPDGFLRSAVFRLRDAPWLETDDDAYEDWYLVEGSAALDVINDAAVTAARKDPHDRAARHAAGGTAGLYRLRQGSENLEAARFAWWLAKPAGMSYDDFYAQLHPLTDQADVGLWGRQMVLGPTPEFTLRSPQPLDLPAGLIIHEFELKPALSDYTQR
jgi:hypothetical protein